MCLQPIGSLFFLLLSSRSQTSLQKRDLSEVVAWGNDPPGTRHRPAGQGKTKPLLHMYLYVCMYVFNAGSIIVTAIRAGQGAPVTPGPKWAKIGHLPACCLLEAISFAGIRWTAT